MKAFTDLTPLGQIRRLRILAKQALHAYNLEDAEYHLLQHGENTTFRVLAPGQTGTNGVKHPSSTLYHPNRYLLRIHRPGYQNETSIASELMWLAALRGDGLPVPEPVPNYNGDLYTIANAPGVPTPRVCSLLRWMNGRFYENNPQPRHIAAVGRLMAHLHTQSETWQPPAGFNRRSWDSEGLFGDNGGFNLPKDQLWALVPETYSTQFRAIADRTTVVMAELDSHPGARGLLHADLHLGNVLFARDALTSQLQARPIDFDDCGYAHWVYDFAVVLGDYITEEPYAVYHDALLSGYAEVRPLPIKQLEHLNAFIAARLVALLLWATDMAQINKGFVSGLDGWYSWASEGIHKCMENIA
jgi:Ser/Thr protein kinase RdoA (MazF antagonist)